MIVSWCKKFTLNRFLRSQFATSKNEMRGGRQYLPYVYMEQGCALLNYYACFCSESCFPY